jgi:hypothetical protein
VDTSQEFAYRLFVPFVPYQAQTLGNDFSASCRGITDEGDRVGFHLRKPTDTTATAILRELNGPVVELPFNGDDSSANGATNKLIPGSLFIVGTHTRPKKAARGFGITFDKTNKKFGPELNVCASMPTLPKIEEDVSVQCINSNGDIVANAVARNGGVVNSHTVNAMDQRLVVGFRKAANIYTWVPLLLPTDPNNITVLGINIHGDISGFVDDGGKTRGFTVNVQSNGSIFGFSMFDHPLATISTRFSGISDDGWIAGTYDEIHPFVVIPEFTRRPIFYWPPHWRNEPDGPPHSRLSSRKDWARYNSQLALQIHELVEQINDEPDRRAIEKPLLDFLNRQIKLLSSTKKNR